MSVRDWEFWQEEIKGVKKLSTKRLITTKLKPLLLLRKERLVLSHQKLAHKKLIHGDTADIDKSSRQKMDKGEYEIGGAKFAWTYS